MWSTHLSPAAADVEFQRRLVSRMETELKKQTIMRQSFDSQSRSPRAAVTAVTAVTAPIVTGVCIISIPVNTHQDRMGGKEKQVQDPRIHLNPETLQRNGPCHPPPPLWGVGGA
ncbi:hypothetical protein FQA47_000221 [Oryzias melastigma]|uniref:Uncharacterized protein n=1 Tax=Oryzias melastigma TaxID=30732 RepID=A0A834C4K1_ORYME|nr:hypothetical protein FQA47_000221 [Oryzias melastigma]